jgi:hypothetical protein
MAGSKGVTVNNVAPTIALTGAATGYVGQSYTLNLGQVTDPGQDAVSSYVVDWGDGTTSTYAAVGDVTHTYTGSGVQTISVDLGDEDGTYLDVASLQVDVQAQQFQTIRIGDAPVRQSGTGGQWAAAWTDASIDITHKANYTSAGESWRAVSLHGVSPQTLAGGDIYQGDLGVSGQSMTTSTVRQELDGREALRFDLEQGATEVTVNLSRFYLNDDSSLHAESGLLRVRDADGNVVAEQAFRPADSSGVQQVTLAAAQSFVAVELLSGAYHGSDFVFGAYVNDDGTFGAEPTSAHGSDFMLDWIEFDFPVIGVLPEPGL